jgi:hypothetical protein
MDTYLRDSSNRYLKIEFVEDINDATYLNKFVNNRIKKYLLLKILKMFFNWDLYYKYIVYFETKTRSEITQEN